MWTPNLAGASVAFCVFLGGRIGGVADPIFLPLDPPLGGPLLASESPGVIQKTAFNNNMRVVFIAGLEGSGHHFVNSVFHMVCRSRDVVCTDICALADVWYNTLATFSTPSEYENGLERLRSEMDSLALTAERLRVEGSAATVATFNHCNGRVGEMSFPNYKGADKPLQYVDLRILAEEAERAGIDLRVIYLSRSAADILISATEHRVFGSVAHEGRVLINAASVIYSSFRELDPKFITCFSYDSITSLAQASRVAEFLMPTAESATLFSQALLDSANLHREHQANQVSAEHTNGWELVANRLQEKIDEIDLDQC